MHRTPPTGAEPDQPAPVADSFTVVVWRIPRTIGVPRVVVPARRHLRRHNASDLATPLTPTAPQEDARPANPLIGVGLALVKWPLLPEANALPLYEGVTLRLTP